MSDVLLPANATEAERAMEQATARIGNVPVPARYMWSPQNCPVALLPWLAWAFSVDTWDPLWTEAQKRAAIAASYGVHRQKGTVGAVRSALAALGMNLDIVEWWEETPKGVPYTFRVSINVDQGSATQEQIIKLLEVVNSSKNLRSHMLGVDVQVNTGADLVFAGVTMIGNEINIQFQHSLLLDGTWNLDGEQELDGVRNI
jgi:phage tail P2-like protein